MIYQKEINLKYDVDVLVAGGGPAGVAAAITAARHGAKVFCAERAQCFGGMATLALVPAFMRFSDGINFLAGEIGREVFVRLYGKDADFTVFSQNPLLLSAKPDAVYIDGKKVFDRDETK